MNIVLPEVDGRIFTRAISFKAPAGALLASQFAQTRHAPEPSRIAFVARARRQLGRVAPQGEPRKKPRADFIGLSRAARARRLRHRARYASERRGDCRGVERGGLRCRRIGAAARSDARAGGRSPPRAAVAGRLSPPVRRIAAGIRERRAKRLGRARARLGLSRRRLSFFVLRVGQARHRIAAGSRREGANVARPITTPTRRRVMSTSPFICGCAIDAPSTR